LRRAMALCSIGPRRRGIWGERKEGDEIDGLELWCRCVAGHVQTPCTNPTNPPSQTEKSHLQKPPYPTTTNPPKKAPTPKEANPKTIPLPKSSSSISNNPEHEHVNVREASCKRVNQTAKILILNFERGKCQGQQTGNFPRSSTRGRGGRCEELEHRMDILEKGEQRKYDLSEKKKNQKVRKFDIAGTASSVVRSLPVQWQESSRPFLGNISLTQGI